MAWPIVPETIYESRKSKKNPTPRLSDFAIVTSLSFGFSRFMMSKYDRIESFFMLYHLDKSDEKQSNTLYTLYH